MIQRKAFKSNFTSAFIWFNETVSLPQKTVVVSRFSSVAIKVVIVVFFFRQKLVFCAVKKF